MFYFFPTLAAIQTVNKIKVSEIFIDLKILKLNFLEVKVLRKYKHPCKNLVSTYCKILQKINRQIGKIKRISEVLKNMYWAICLNQANVDGFRRI